MVGSHLGYGYGHESAALGQAALPANRLDQLNITAIQNRILVAPPVERLASEPPPQARGFGNRLLIPGDPGSSVRGLPQLSEGEKQILQAVMQNPTADELADLSLIDGFFYNPGATMSVEPLTQGVCQALKNPRAYGIGAITPTRPATPASRIASWLLYQPLQPRGWGRRVEPNATADEISDIKGSDFFCPDPAEFFFPNKIKVDHAGFFNVDPNQLWGSVKLQVHNAKTVTDVLTNYPFPPPIDLFAAQFWFTMQADMAEIARAPGIVDPEVVRYWTTMAVLVGYSAMVDRIQAELKAKGKRDRRQAMMKIIGLAIVSIVAFFLLPAVIVAVASAIKTAAQTYIDAQKRRKAAQDMADTAKLFEKDAPAFSAEVDHAAQMLDEQAARDQASQPNSPELQAAIGEIPSNKTPLLVAGGLGVAGLAAFLIFR